MKRIIKKIKQNLIGFILGAIIFSIIGVYAATQIASSNVTYTNNNQENVQGAIDDLYQKSKDYNVCSENKNITTAKKCKRAEYLHQETCNRKDSYGCMYSGYTKNGSKKTTTIIYGNCGTSGSLIAGDAFDCDVNGDGYYDPLTERFYYISEYFNTSTKLFENDTAVLIYYNNVFEGKANNTTKYAYDNSNENWHGPQTAKLQLPTTSQWSNIRLKNTSRAILNEIGGTSTVGGTLPGSHSYEGYAARLLTAQEVNAACNIIIGSFTTGELDTCQYLMENTKFSSTSSSIGTYGYWLETPGSSNSHIVWSVFGSNRNMDNDNANSASYYGVRPAIEVAITDIEY